jgi:hypothetical protein
MEEKLTSGNKVYSGNQVCRRDGVALRAHDPKISINKKDAFFYSIVTVSIVA